jgi:hypothetical protein
MEIYEIRKLSNQFFTDYPKAHYPELEHKIDRPYDVVLFETHYDFLICVPFRSNIRHQNGYLFKHSLRSLSNKSGLDYSKIVIVKNPNYIGVISTVDRDEFLELDSNSTRIHKHVLNYVIDYRNHVSGSKILHPSMFSRKYMYSSLQYFHSELGLPK